MGNASSRSEHVNGLGRNKWFSLSCPVVLAVCLELWSLGLVIVLDDASEEDFAKDMAPETQAGAEAEEQPELTEGTVPRGGRARLQSWEGGGPSGMT